MQDAFRDMMMDTINDIQKRNGCFYISSMVKECNINCSINNKNMVNITYTVFCDRNAENCGIEFETIEEMNDFIGGE